MENLCWKRVVICFDLIHFIQWLFAYIFGLINVCSPSYNIMLHHFIIYVIMLCHKFIRTSWESLFRSIFFLFFAHTMLFVIVYVISLNKCIHLLFLYYYKYNVAIMACLGCWLFSETKYNGIHTLAKIISDVLVCNVLAAPN